MKIVSSLFMSIVACFNLQAQRAIPGDVLQMLKFSNNKIELLNTLQHYQLRVEDSLKFKAACFLILNLDIHYSQTYYLTDTAGSQVPFDELKYPDFSSSVKAFDSLKKINHKLRKVSVQYKDLDSIKSNYLIDNIDQAFLLWQSPLAKNISFEDFCEYLLPYRISIEPLQNWRPAFTDKFKWIINESKNLDSILYYLKTDINKWFTCTYNLEKRNEPLPRLGGLQLLQRKKGPCEDVADMTVFALRSMGIPASIDVVPFWATSSGNHTLNVVFSNNKIIPYDILLLYDSLKNFIREPAKVLRITYSEQKNTLPFFEPKFNIPPGFLREVNYKDVTEQYWPVRNVTCKLWNDTLKQKIVYACVLNGQKWEPTWWGFVYSDTVVFNNMCQGAVFLPMYYINGKLVPAGYPVASGYTNIITLHKSTITHSISLPEQANYLLYRPGKKYKLYYWDNEWKMLEEKIATDRATTLSFDNVPKDALLLMIPEYSQKKERPFIITEDGKRVWW